MRLFQMMENLYPQAPLFDHINKTTKTIRIKNGNYNGEELEKYLNETIFSQNELKRIACKYDVNTLKFHFFRDIRESNLGGDFA